MATLQVTQSGSSPPPFSGWTKALALAWKKLASHYVRSCALRWECGHLCDKQSRCSTDGKVFSQSGRGYSTLVSILWPIPVRNTIPCPAAANSCIFRRA